MSFQVPEVPPEESALPDMTVPETMERYVRWQANRVKASTLRTHKSQFGQFAAAFHGRRVRDLSRSQLQWYVNERELRSCVRLRPAPGGGRACALMLDLKSCPVLVNEGACQPRKPARPSSIRQHFNAVETWFEFLAAHGVHETHHWRELRKDWLRRNRHRLKGSGKRGPSLAEVRQLLHHASRPPERMLVFLLVKTGLRIEDALRLRWDDRADVAGLPFLRLPGGPVKSASEHDQLLPVDSELDRELDRFATWSRDLFGELDGFRIICGIKAREPSYNTVYRHWMKPLWAAAGLDGRGYDPHHSFRHTFTTELRRNGLDEGWTEILRGCKPPGNMATYHHPSPGEIHSRYTAAMPSIFGGASATSS